MITKIVNLNDVKKLLENNKESTNERYLIDSLICALDSIKELDKNEVDRYYKDKQNGGKCHCFKEEVYYTPDEYGNNYVRKEYVCFGTKEKEKCTCMGNRDKCNFYFYN